MPTIDQLRRSTCAIGRELSDASRTATERIWADAGRVSPAGLRIALDQQYGQHARHRLDVFSAPGQESKPVFVYVHGGGFTGGDKRKPESYLFENIGAWAVAQGMIGVNLTYRLAPGHQWPSAIEDIGAALQWVRANIQAYGGNPDAIVLAGHSAGAAHVANYVAHAKKHDASYPAVQGTVLMSGIYDIEAAAKRPSIQVYYGTDAAAHKEQSSIAGLAASDVPIFVSVAEEEPYEFHRQALWLVNAVAQQRSRIPAFVVAQGHNHFSETYHFGSDDTQLTGPIAIFARQLFENANPAG